LQSEEFERNLSSREAAAIAQASPIRGKCMRLVHLLIPALALFSSHHAIAQGSYPDRPIKMIVPLAAASAVDVAARIVTQKMAP
jgi:hypothetical protein